MGALHWLVLIPVYYFATISLFALLDVSARVLRMDTGPDRLATSAIAASVIGLVGLFALGVVSIGDFTLLPILGLVLLSFVLAGLDAIVTRALPLPSDGSDGRRRASDPQVF